MWVTSLVCPRGAGMGGWGLWLSPGRVAAHWAGEEGSKGDIPLWRGDRATQGWKAGCGPPPFVWFHYPPTWTTSGPSGFPMSSGCSWRILRWLSWWGPGSGMWGLCKGSGLLWGKVFKLTFREKQVPLSHSFLCPHPRLLFRWNMVRSHDMIISLSV